MTVDEARERAQQILRQLDHYSGFKFGLSAERDLALIGCALIEAENGGIEIARRIVRETTIPSAEGTRT